MHRGLPSHYLMREAWPMLGGRRERGRDESEEGGDEVKPMAKPRPNSRAWTAHRLFVK
jgi:hypothetical protein